MTASDISDIYEQHLEAIYKFFYFRTFDVATAEDLTSQTFLIFVRKVKDSEMTLQKPEKFLFGVMRKVWLRYLQEKYRRQEHSVENIDDFQAYVETEVEAESTSGDHERIRRYINKLPPAQARVMELRLLNKYELKEICQELGKNMNYVKTTQRRGIKRLKQLVQEAELNFGEDTV